MDREEAEKSRRLSSSHLGWDLLVMKVSRHLKVSVSQERPLVPKP